MNEKELMDMWYQTGGVVVHDGNLVEALSILTNNNIKDFYLSYLGGRGWGLAKMY